MGCCRSRWRRAIAFAGFGLGLLATSLTPPETSIAESPAPRAEKPEPFSHKDHVPQVWAGKTPEERRDCRGCHRFAAGNASAPQSECSKCHGGAKKFTFTASAGWSKDLERGRRIGRSFRHSEHAAFTCRECHRPQGNEVPAHLPVPIGAAACARCHGDEVTTEAVGDFQLALKADWKPGEPKAKTKLKIDDPKELRTRFTAALNKRLTPSANQLFRHEDHLDTTNLTAAKEADCTRCHDGIKTAGAGKAGNGKFQQKACKECHQAKGKVPLAFQPAKPKQRRAWTVGTFGHDDHFRFRTPGADRKDIGCTNDAYDAISKTSCQHCHAFAPNEDPEDYRDFPFADNSENKTGSHKYATCETCHQGKRWKTKEGVHGNWGACKECHEFGSGQMSENRRRTPVVRLSASKFKFTSHAHPYISKAGNAADDETAKACKKCHLRSIPALPSRLNGRLFNHETHAGAACTQCHAGVGESKSADDLANTGRTYILGRKGTDLGCALCHKNSAVAEIGDKTPGTKGRVLRFSHAAHLVAKPKDGETPKCSDCHTREGAEMKTIEPDGCLKCHGHGEDPAKRRRTADIGRSEVQSCQTCHGEEIPVVQSPDKLTKAPFIALQNVFGGFIGNQHHETGQKCVNCHEILDPMSPKTDHVSGTLEGKFHTERPYPPNCFGCHWRKPNLTWSSWAATSPENEDMRKKYGNDLVNFPGPDARGEDK